MLLTQLWRGEFSRSGCDARHVARLCESNTTREHRRETRHRIGEFTLQSSHVECHTHQRLSSY